MYKLVASTIISPHFPQRIDLGRGFRFQLLGHVALFPEYPRGTSMGKPGERPGEAPDFMVILW